MRGEKGQITLFVLLGLLILIIIIILIVIRNQNSDQPLQGVDQATLEAYIANCVDNAAENAIATMGLQGGIFQKSQSFSEDVTIDGILTPIAYGLKNDNSFPIAPPKTDEEFLSQGVQFDTQLEDPYPWPSMSLVMLYQNLQTTGLTPSSYAPSQYDGFFGQFSLPKLCNSNQKCGNADFYPMGFDDRDPMMTNLQDHTRQLLLACLDEATLSEYVGREVVVGEPVVEVTLGSKNTLFEVETPLVAQDSTGVLRATKTSRDYPINILQTYKFIYKLLKRESKDPNFNVQDDSSIIPDGEFYIVQKQKLTTQQVGRDDIYLLTVQDTTSRVKDSNWVVQFLIENRKPLIELTTFNAIENTLYVDYEYLDPDENIPSVQFQIKDIENTIHPVPINQLSTNRIAIDLLSLPENSDTDGFYLLNVSVTDTFASDWEIFTFNRVADE